MDNYFQTIRYGWGSKTPIAALFRFPEFQIVDCRFKPNLETALQRNLKKFHYSQYSDKETFAEIYWLFSREAVAGGSLEKYVAALPKNAARCSGDLPVAGSPSEMCFEPADAVSPPNTTYLPSGLSAMSAPNFVVCSVSGAVDCVTSTSPTAACCSSCRTAGLTGRDRRVGIALVVVVDVGDERRAVRAHRVAPMQRPWLSGSGAAPVPGRKREMCPLRTPFTSLAVQ